MDAWSAEMMCDSMVTRDDGPSVLVESMFSPTTDLSADHGEILARLHPVKKRGFDKLRAGVDMPVAVRMADGRLVRAAVEPDVRIAINGPAGPVGLPYSEVARSGSPVIGEVSARGFDAGAEPLIRQLADRTFRLVFCTMPPRQHRLGSGFDVDHFGETLVKRCKADIRWEDHDVYWIGSDTSAADIKEILAFLTSYAGI